MRTPMNIAFRTPLFLALVSASAAAQGAPVQGAPAQAAPVKAHICLAPTSVETSTGTAATAMSAVRETFTSFLTGPTLETAPLTSRLASTRGLIASTGHHRLTYNAQLERVADVSVHV